jgi:Short C-terminal domain
MMATNVGTSLNIVRRLFIVIQAVGFATPMGTGVITNTLAGNRIRMESTTTATATDKPGNPSIARVGTGSADTSERLHDHAIAGKRGMEDALVKMQAAILETRFASTITAAPPTKTPSPTTNDGDRLAHVKDLRDKGLITQEEYEAKRQAIVDA